MQPRQHDSSRWAKDTSTSRCIACETPFSVLIRRHHCRSCGEIFCEACCNKLAVIPVPPEAHGAREKVRVCQSCQSVCDKAAALAMKTTSGGSGNSSNNNNSSNGNPSYTDLVRYAWYWTVMASRTASAVVRKRRAITKADNLLTLDVVALKEDIHRKTWGGGGGKNGPPPVSGGSKSTKDPLVSTTTTATTAHNNYTDPNSTSQQQQQQQAPASGGGNSPKDDSPMLLASTATNFLQMRNSVGTGQSELETPAEALTHFFSVSSTSKLRQLEARMERLTNKALAVLRIMERHSLTHFFLEMYQHLCELLMQSFIANLDPKAQPNAAAAPTTSPLASPTGRGNNGNNITEAQHAKSVRRLQLHGHDVELAASAALSRTVLNLEALRLPSLAAGTQLASFEGCDILEDMAEHLAAAITIRYQEQICCLTESASEILATTAAARIHHRVHGHAIASEEDFVTLLNHVSLEDYAFDAILNERPPGVKEQALRTRLRDVDQRWTDHGALSCCGLATPEGQFFDPVYLGSPQEAAAKASGGGGGGGPSLVSEDPSGNRMTHSVAASLLMSTPSSGVPAAKQVASSVASKYYYRHGTYAEALAMKMTPTGPVRHHPSPMWSAQMLYDQHELLSVKRDEMLTSYSRVPYFDLNSNNWMSILNPSYRNAAAAAGSKFATSSFSTGTGGVSSATAPTPMTLRAESISFRVDMLRTAVRVCKDYVSNPESLRQVLIRRYRSIYADMEVVQNAMEQLKLRAEDIQDTPRSSAEARGLLVAIDRITVLNKSERIQSQLSAFHRYHKFLNPASDVASPAATFYLHLRTKLLMVLLAASRTELQDDIVTLMGVPVPYSPKVALALDAMFAQASRHAIYKHWSLPDVVDLHTERMARVLTDRFRDTMNTLSVASIIVFADCCVARLFYLFSHDEEEWNSRTSALSAATAATGGKSSSSQKTANSRANNNTAHRFDSLLEVSVVEKIEQVDLFDTIVKAKKIYLTLADHRSTLCEHGIHVKSGLCSADGVWYAGAVETHGKDIMHHRGPKYGIIHAFPGEIERKKLLKASADWSLDANTISKPKQRLSFFGPKNTLPQTIPPLIKPPPADNDKPHWGSSFLSVGPRLVGPGEVVGVTLIAKTKSGRAIVLPPSLQDALNFYALTGEEGRLEPRLPNNSSFDGSSAGAAAAAPATSTGSKAKDNSNNSEAPTGTAIVKSFQCATAGTLIIAAELEGRLLIGNAVRVRPGRVDWPVHCSVDAHPSNVVAGDTVTVTMTLRDEYCNVTSTTSPDDFSIAIDNNGTSVIASSIVEETEGKFKFVFVPTNEGPIDITITAAGVPMVYQPKVPLRCIAGPPDFKNSMFSLDEWEVVAGTTVNGNLLLRDVYGNKVEVEDEHPLVELINGGTTIVPVERVHRGEYIFSFCPIKQGCAILRATSLRSFASLIARITVEAPKEVDWQHSTVSCLSKILFAGEVAEFHIVLRDRYGNCLQSSSALPSDFQCWLRYVDGEDSENQRKAQLTNSFSSGGGGGVVAAATATTTAASSNGKSLVVQASQVTGSGGSFAFRVTPGAVGNIVACVAFHGAHVESVAMQVRSAPMHWPSSKVTVSATAVVGEWFPVLIDCRDRFSNPSEAQDSDFSVVAFHGCSAEEEGERRGGDDDGEEGIKRDGDIDSSSSNSKIKTKPVCGAGSHFGFQVMDTKTGTLRIIVTYAGYLKHECRVTMLPMPMSWSTTMLSIKPVLPSSSTHHQQDSSSAAASLSRTPQVTAGETLKVALQFKDQFSNRTHKTAMSDGKFEIVCDNEGRRIVLDASNESLEDSDATWCRAVYHVVPTVAGHVNVRAVCNGDEKHARAAIIPNVIDWEHCTLKIVSGATSHDPQSVVAGTSVAWQIRLFDSYDNPVVATPQAVQLRMVNATTDERDQRVDIIGDVRASTGNELLVQCVPELSGSLILEALLDVTTNPTLYGKGIVGDVKTLVYGIIPATLDWLGKSVAKMPEHVIAGEIFELELYLRDTLDNPCLLESWEDGMTLDWCSSSSSSSGGGTSASATAHVPHQQQGSSTSSSSTSCPFGVVLTEARNTTTHIPRRIVNHPNATTAAATSLSASASPISSPRQNSLDASPSPSSNNELFSLNSTTNASRLIIPAMAKQWIVKNKEKGLLVTRLRATVSGTAMVVLSCSGTNRPQVPIAVEPATTWWAHTELVWDAPSLSVGVPVACRIRWRDMFGNLTSVNNPAHTSLKATLHQQATFVHLQDSIIVCESFTTAALLPPRAVPSQEYISLPVAEDAAIHVTSIIAGSAYLSLSREEEEHHDAPSHGGGGENGHIMESEKIPVHAAAVSWAHSLLALVPPEAAAGAAASCEATPIRRAGVEVRYLLTLRDLYTNDCISSVHDCKKDLRVQVLMSGSCGPVAAVEPASRVDCGKPSHFIVRFVPTVAAEYTISVGLKSESETCDLMQTILIAPAAVSWTSHSRLYADSEVVTAGGSVFLQLACKDAYGNATSVGVVPEHLVFDLRVVPPLYDVARKEVVEGVALPRGRQCAAGVTIPADVCVLPQEEGLLGVVVEPTLSGRLYVQVHQDGHSDRISLDEPVDVIPTVPHWETCELISEHARVVAGQAAAFGLVLRDKYLNVISPITHKLPSSSSTNGGGNRAVASHNTNTHHKQQQQQQHHSSGGPNAPRGAAANNNKNSGAADKKKKKKKKRKENVVVIDYYNYMYPEPDAEDEDGPEYETDNDAHSSEGNNHDNNNDSVRSEHIERGQSQDDLTEDLHEAHHHHHSGLSHSGHAVGDESGKAAAAEFHRSSLQHLRVVCENNNTDPSQPQWAILASHPEEHKSKSLLVDVKPCGGDQAPPFHSLCASRQASVVFTVIPTIAGACTMRLTHTDYEHVHTASLDRVESSSIQEGELLPGFPSHTVAGVSAEFSLKLRDVSGNWVCGDGGTFMESLTKQLQVRAVSSSSSGVDDHNAQQQRPVKNFDWKLATNQQGHVVVAVTPTVAERIIVTVIINSVAPPIPLREVSLLVTPAPIHAAHSVLTVAAGAKPMAGEKLTFDLVAYDAFHNLVTNPRSELLLNASSAVADPGSRCAALSCVNGTSRPEISVVEESEQKISFEATPAEKGAISIVLCDHNGGKRATDPLPVLPAPMHWPSCAVRFSDETVALGSTTNVLIQIRDRFMNPVEAESNQFRLEITNDGITYLATDSASSAVVSAPPPPPPPPPAAATTTTATTTSDGGAPPPPPLASAEGEPQQEGDDHNASSSPRAFEAAAAAAAELPHLPECEGFQTRKGKTLLCEVKPVAKGVLQARVVYCDVEPHVVAEPKVSNPIQVV